MLVVKRKSGLPTMDSFLNDFFGRNFFNDLDIDFMPKVRSKENKDNYELSFALPGFKKEDININIEDDVLIISSKVEKDDFKQSFENRYQIPEDVDIEKINATMEDGILKISVGKYKELPKTNIKRIDIA
ncbi:MAG: Hsp20/alpha crystallin family protein [Nanoarchaeota archaeon]